MKKSLCIFLVTVLCVTLCMGAFSLSACAAVNPDYLVPSFSGTPSIDNSFVAFKNSSNDTYRFAVNSARMSGTCVACFYPGYILFLCTSRPDGYWLYYSSNGSSFNNYNAYNTITYDSTTYYIFQWNASSATEIYCIQTSSYDAALSACVNALNYSPPEPEPQPTLNDGGIYLSGMSSTNYSFVVPAGYMAVIEYQDELILHVQQSFSSYSSVLTASGSAFPNSTAFTVDSNVLPASGDSFQFPSNSVTQIPYTKSGPLTAVLRQSKSGSSVITKSYVSDFLFVCNPSSSLYSDHGQLELNFDLICSVNHCDTIRLYPVTTTIHDSSNITYLTTSISGYPYYYTVSGLLRDPSQTSNLSVLDTPGSDDDEQSVYSRLLSNLTQFFSKGWSSVRSVLDAIGEFPQFFVTLLGGLPSDITSIIAGFVAILCCIGVVKALI